MAGPIPEGFHRVTPICVFKDARRAIEFYRRAFGAEELYVMPGADGKGVMHAEIRIGDSIIMVGEEHPQEPHRSAETLGGSPVGFYLYLENADEAFATALAAGAVARMPVQEMFWGDRVGTVQDPFGYNWWIATRTRELTPEQIRQGAREAFARMAEK
jgi:uncharacterized glyoxalase superfamily protein PhnB